MPEPAPFFDAYESFAAKKGMKPPDVSKLLNIPHNTYRTWKDRGKFGAWLLPKLDAVLGWKVTADEAEALGVQLTRKKKPPVSHHAKKAGATELMRTFAKADDIMADAFATIDEVCHQAPDLFGSMRKNDCFVFAANTVMPREFDKKYPGPELAASAAVAVKKGAILLYIQATEDAVSSLRQLGFTDESLIKESTASEAFAQFREVVRSSLAKEMAEEDGRRLSHTRVQQCFVNSFEFWAPGCTFGLFASYLPEAPDRERLVSRMTLRLPGDRLGGIIPYPEYQTLSDRFILCVRKVVKDRLKTLQSGAGNRATKEIKWAAEFFNDLTRIFEAPAQHLGQ